MLAILACDSWLVWRHASRDADLMPMRDVLKLKRRAKHDEEGESSDKDVLHLPNAAAPTVGLRIGGGGSIREFDEECSQKFGG